MALANIAVLLSQMGRRVLVVDWDLEAPGLDQYFKKYISPAELSKPGLLDLFLAVEGVNSNLSELTWRDLIIEVDVEGRCPISLITSGQKHDKGYIGRVVQFNWENFFSEFDGGEYIEKLRNEWREEFDLVLIDSRTGITDSGGVCTIQMPDVLVLVFTANSQSIDGIKEIALSAQKARQDLAYDREQVLFFPLLSRFDSRAEFEVSQKWLKCASESLVDFYDWLPETYSAYDFLEQTKLPHIARFSFGEELPAIDQRITDPEGLSHAYQKTAELLANKFSEESIHRLLGLTQLNEDSISALVIAAKEKAESTFEELEKQSLEILQVDAAKIEKVNSDLQFIADLDRKGYLDDRQQNVFSALKLEVYFLLKFDESLERLRSASNTILEEIRITLIKKIEFLKIEGEKILDSKTLAHLVPERKCKESELRALENFIQELKETGRISAWIDKRRKALSKRFGHEALKAFPDIENTIDSDRVSYFCFSIDQFLEQVVHCLKWGRYDILDSPGIPLVLDCCVYERAFYLIKEAIEKDLPTRFNQASRNLANDCIDYLIAQLPFYEEEE